MLKKLLEELQGLLRGISEITLGEISAGTFRDMHSLITGGIFRKFLETISVETFGSIIKNSLHSDRDVTLKKRVTSENTLQELLIRISEVTPGEISVETLTEIHYLNSFVERSRVSVGSLKETLPDLLKEFLRKPFKIIKEYSLEIYE